MALSHRFGLIRSLTDKYEEITSEDCELLKTVKRESTLFHSSDLVFDMHHGGEEFEKEGQEKEKEWVDPIWIFEFQRIMKKCKGKQTLDFNKVFDRFMLKSDGKLNDNKKFSENLPERNCLAEEHNADVIRKQAKVYDSTVTLPEKPTYSNMLHSDDSDSNSDNSFDDLGLRESQTSHDQFKTCLKNTKKVVTKFNSDMDLEFPKNERNYPNANRYASVPAVKEAPGKPCRKNTGKHSNDDNLTNSSSNDVQEIRNAKLDKSEPVVDSAVREQKDKIIKKIKNNNQANKEVHVPVKTHKSSIKVIPAMSFPLDELLPQEPVKDTEPVKGPCTEEKQTLKPDMNVTEDNPVSVTCQQDIYSTNLPDYVFHGEVYASPFSSGSDSNDSANLDTNQLRNDFQSSMSNVSLENFSFIRDALHSGNSAFVEQLQNAISQQLRSDYLDEQCHGDISNQINQYEHEDNSTPLGYYTDRTVSGGDAQPMPWGPQGSFVNVDDERVISEKGDNLDTQCKELFELFINQCSQFVKTDDDQRRLSSIVNLLKRESGTELNNTGFTPPQTPIAQFEMDNGGSSDGKNTETTEANLELFEGRTLLKGGVEPRRIPKTTLVKCGSDRPTDPRPISTILSKTVPKPLPLPEFVYDLWDEEHIQRILTLDWDCKRTLYMEESDSHNKTHKLNNKEGSAHYSGTKTVKTDSETEIQHSYNPSKELQKYSKKVSTKQDIEKVKSDIAQHEVTTADTSVSPDAGSTPVRDEIHDVSTEEKNKRDTCVNPDLQSSVDEDVKLLFYNPTKHVNLGTCETMTKDTNTDGKEKEKEPPIQRSYVSLGKHVKESASSWNFDLNSVDKSGSFFNTTFTLVDLPQAKSTMDFPVNTERDNTLNEFDRTLQGNLEALDLTIRQNKCSELVVNGTDSEKMGPYCLSEVKPIPTVVSCVNRQESNSSTNCFVPNNNNLVVLNDVEPFTEEPVKDESNKLYQHLTPSLTNNSLKLDKENIACMGAVKPVPVNTKSSKVNVNKPHGNEKHHTVKTSKEKITPTKKELDKMVNTVKTPKEKITPTKKELDKKVNTVKTPKEKITPTKKELDKKVNTVKIPKEKITPTKKELVNTVKTPKEKITPTKKELDKKVNTVKTPKEKITPTKKELINTVKTPKEKITPTKRVFDERVDSLKNTHGKSKKTSEKTSQERKRTKASPLERKSLKHDNAKTTETITIDLTLDNSSEEKYIPSAKRTKTNNTDRTMKMTRVTCSKYDNISNHDEVFGSKSGITNDRKRKVDSKVLSDLEEGQIMSDSGSDVDSKLSTTENNSMRIKALKQHSRHSSDRKRHSSCSSVESSQLEEGHHHHSSRSKHRHKSTSSTSSRQGSRNSSPWRQRSSDRHSTESRTDSGRKRHHTSYEESRSSKEKRSRLETETTSRFRANDDQQMFSDKSYNKIPVDIKTNRIRNSSFETKTYRYNDSQQVAKEKIQVTASVDCYKETETNRKRYYSDEWSDHQMVIEKIPTKLPVYHYKESETNRSRYSNERQMYNEKAHTIKPIDLNKGKSTRSNYYDLITSPESRQVSDEILSQEYHMLFGKSSQNPHSSSSKQTNKTTTKDKIFSQNLPGQKVDKSLLDDLAFLQNYKQKVEQKAVPSLSSDTKKEKTLNLEQELEDRKFLQLCKKKLEEKAIKSVHERLGGKSETGSGKNRQSSCGTKSEAGSGGKSQTSSGANSQTGSDTRCKKKRRKHLTL